MPCFETAKGLSHTQTVLKNIARTPIEHMLAVARMAHAHDLISTPQLANILLANTLSEPDRTRRILSCGK